MPHVFFTAPLAVSRGKVDPFPSCSSGTRIRSMSGDGLVMFGFPETGFHGLAVSCHNSPSGDSILSLLGDSSIFAFYFRFSCSGIEIFATVHHDEGTPMGNTTGVRKGRSFYNSSDPLELGSLATMSHFIAGNCRTGLPCRAGEIGTMPFLLLDFLGGNIPH